MTDKKYEIDGSDILVYNKKEYCIMFVEKNKLGLVELPNLKLKHQVRLSERFDVTITTVEQIQNSLENNENRKAGYFGLYEKEFKEIVEAIQK